MKKGFTLVEMLAIIVILGVLGTIGVATFNNTQNKAKQKLYQEQLNNIEIALRRYITENEGRTIDIYGTRTKLDIFTDNNSFNIPVSFLVQEEYLKELPVNPNCGKQINGYYQIYVENPGTYKLTYYMSNTEETFCRV